MGYLYAQSYGMLKCFYSVEIGEFRGFLTKDADS